MSNYPFVDYYELIANCEPRKSNRIDRIVIHHCGGVYSVENIAEAFRKRDSSANYGIGADGRIALFVEEKNHSYCSSNYALDDRGVTIEVSNCMEEGDWPVSEQVFGKLLDLVTDICRRNGIERLYFDGTPEGSNLHMHKWYADTLCPGPYLGGRFPMICEEVNRRLKDLKSSEQR